MVRVLVLKQLYNLSDEQMESQLLDRMSHQRFCQLEHSLNVPVRNTIWRFGQLLGLAGATALFEGAELQLRRHGYIARGEQAIDKGAGASTQTAQQQRRTRSIE